MTNGEFTDIVLKMVEIDGSLSLSRSRVTGDLNMNGATIKGSLYLTGSTLARVDLTTATVGQQLNAISSSLNGSFEAGGLSTGGSLLLRDGATFAEVILRGARIGGQISLSRSRFRGTFDGQSMTVAQDFHMVDARFERPAELSLINVAGTLDVGGTTLTALNLTGATIANDFAFGAGGETVQWTDVVDIEGRHHKPLLSLWNTSVGGLVDDPESWPENLQILLRDFRYERLTPLPRPGQGIGKLRDAAWYVDWLAQDSTGSLQPYQQLARVLMSYGADATARTVLIAGRERHREALPWWSPERWFLFALRWTIGYGYGAGELYALLWALLFVLIGTAIARSHGRILPNGERLGFWYSLDMLLPGMQLSEWHAKIDLPQCTRYYFHFHRLAGYILLLFVVAGLTGLTEPE